MPRNDRRSRRARARAAAQSERGALRTDAGAAPAAEAARPVVLGTAAAIGALLLVLYVATAARDLVYGDSPELVTAAATLGVAHAPGYPLWTILANAFTRLPIDTLSFRVSLFSAICATAAVLVTYATAFRLSRSVLASACAATLLGVAPVFWSWAIVPEVFALHALLASVVVALLVSWHLGGRTRDFVGAAFAGGLGLAHQQTIVLIAPAALYLLWTHRDVVRRDGLLWRGAVALAAGLVPYAYLPIAASRQPAWNYGDIQNAGDFFAQILRSDLGSGQLISDRAFQGGSLIDRLVFYGQSFDLASAALIAIALVSLYRSDRGLFGFFSVAAALAGPAFVIYANVDLNAVAILRSVVERFFILSHVVLAPLCAVGLVIFEARLRRRGTPVLAIASATAAALGIVVAFANASSIDQRDNHNARHFAEDFLASVPPNKVLLASGDAIIWPIEYLHRIEAVRPDVTVVDTPLLTFAWYVRQVAREHPDLTLTASRYDGRTGTSRQLVEPNGVDRFEVAGSLLDDSLQQAYAFVRRGLLLDIRPKSAPVDLDAVASLNDQQLRSYRIPRPDAVAGRNWDRVTLADYAFVAYDVAQAYEARGAAAQARVWYTRALAIDPDLSEAKAALARLPK